MEKANSLPFKIKDKVLQRTPLSSLLNSKKRKSKSNTSKFSGFKGYLEIKAGTDSG